MARRQQPEAFYSRFLDGETLWAAVRHVEDGDRLVLATDDTDLDLPWRAGEEPGIAEIRVDVAQALSQRSDEALELPMLRLSGRRRRDPVARAATLPASPMLPAPSTRDRRWQFATAVDGGVLVVRRTALRPSVQITAISTRDGSVVVRLDSDARRATLKPADDDGSDAVDVSVDVSDGTVWLDGSLVDSLAPGVGYRMRVAGRPAVRARHLLRQPSTGLVLPRIANQASVSFARSGQLVVRREAAG